MTLSAVPSSAAQKLIVLGIMAWGAKVEVPRSRRANAKRRFSAIILKAKAQGFDGSPQLTAGLRAGKATPKVIERAEAVCALVSETEIDAELRAAAELEREVGVFGRARRPIRQPT